MLSPAAGRVVGCTLVGLGMAMMMVMGKEGWMQRAGVMQGRVEVSPPPSSCSADGHSPGKQASEHSLLSSAFTCAMPKSLLLSHLRPRKAPVLGPGRELRQLTPRLGAGACRCLFSGGGWDLWVFSSPLPTLFQKKKKKRLK